MFGGGRADKRVGVSVDPLRISIEAISAQTQAMVRQEVGVRVFKAALDAESATSLQLIQMMNQTTGIGTQFDAQA